MARLDKKIMLTLPGEIRPHQTGGQAREHGPTGDHPGVYLGGVAPPRRAKKLTYPSWQLAHLREIRIPKPDNPAWASLRAAFDQVCNWELLPGRIEAAFDARQALPLGRYVLVQFADFAAQVAPNEQDHAENQGRGEQAHNEDQSRQVGFHAEKGTPGGPLPGKDGARLAGYRREKPGRELRWLSTSARRRQM